MPPHHRSVHPPGTEELLAGRTALRDRAGDWQRLAWREDRTAADGPAIVEEAAAKGWSAPPAAA